jgi:hypothetical protein
MAGQHGTATSSATPDVRYVARFEMYREFLHGTVLCVRTSSVRGFAIGGSIGVVIGAPLVTISD